MSPRPTNQLSLENSIFLGKDADALSVLVAKQMEAVFDQAGIIIPVRSCSLLSLLEETEPASAADLSKGLGQSHQLILQKIPALLKAKLIRRKRDQDDARRRVFTLTSLAREQLDLLRRLSPAIRDVYAELYRELGVDLRAVLEQASRSLEEKPLEERFPASAFPQAGSE